MDSLENLPAVVEGLRCPVCHGTITVNRLGGACVDCDRVFASRLEGRGLDMRPPTAFEVTTTTVVGSLGPDEGEFGHSVLKMNPNPEIASTGREVPRHLTPELISWIPAPRRSGSLVLDLGCGAGQNRELLESAGYRYVGVDYSDPSALILTDAHCLPFEDGLFDLVVSIAVLEHLHAPTLAMSEVGRVLRTTGKLVGTVAFLEPYHARSFYNHTALGVVNTMVAAGLEPEIVAAQPRYSLLDACSKVIYNGAPNLLKRIFMSPFRAAHRTWWMIARRLRAGDYSEERRVALTAGTWVFVASRSNT